MIDKEQLEYLETEIEKRNGTIVDIGCGKGGIT